MHLQFWNLEFSNDWNTWLNLIWKLEKNEYFCIYYQTISGITCSVGQVSLWPFSLFMSSSNSEDVLEQHALLKAYTISIQKVLYIFIIQMYH